MKLTSKHLQNINITKRMTLPILEYALIDPDYITVTDLNITYRVNNPGIPVPVDKVNKIGFLVDRKKFVKLYKQLGEILQDKSTTVSTFEPEGRGMDHTVKFHTKKGTFTLPSMDIDEFPNVPSQQGATITVLQSDSLLTLSKFTSSDDLRPAMCGIFIDKINMVATDGHVMKWIAHRDNGIRFKGEPNTNYNNNVDRGMIIPNEALSYISNDWYQLAQSITVNSNPTSTINYGVLRGKEDSIVFPIVPESYPTYGSVIPNEQDDDIVVQVVKDAVYENLNFCKEYGNEHTHQVKITLQNGHIVLESEDVSMNTRFQSPKIPVFTNYMEEFIIGFNGKYFEKCLKHTDNEFKKAKLRMSAPNRAIVIDENTLLMPIILNKD